LPRLRIANYENKKKRLDRGTGRFGAADSAPPFRRRRFGARVVSAPPFRRQGRFGAKKIFLIFKALQLLKQTKMVKNSQ
jgi:hypothetical protein